jgi:hypothetical protein
MAGGIATSGGISRPGISANGLPGMNANGISISNTGRMMKEKSPTMGSPMQVMNQMAEDPAMRVMMSVPPMMRPQMPDFMREPERFTLCFVHPNSDI